ncbi:MAG: helix-turn-helix transcriptional regulator [Clostridia bacterium]|nr:helix-turn-helix transcriptional regulator [Clostridia bacterium]
MMDTKKEFGEILKALRTEKGLGQVQLAKELDVSKSVISLWELGGADPTLSNLKKIARFFNVSIDFLAGMEL